jgi:hypothetical protein
MSSLTLLLGDRSFQIPKKILISNCDFLDVRPEFYDERSYQVESQVSPADFDEFCTYLKFKQVPHITTANVISFLQLSAEFLTPELDEVCGLFLAANRCGGLNIGRRVDALEEQQADQLRLFDDLHRRSEDTRQVLADSRSAADADSEETRRDLGKLRGEFEDLRSGLEDRGGEIESLRRELAELRGEIETLRSVTFRSEQLYRQGQERILGHVGDRPSPLLGLPLLKESAELGHQDAAVAYDRHERLLMGEKAEPREVPESARYFKLHHDCYNKVRRQGGAICVEIGDEVARDPSLAVRYFKRLADEGDSWGQLNFGICCEYGIGTTEDPAVAAKYYKYGVRELPIERSRIVGVRRGIINVASSELKEILLKLNFLVYFTGIPSAQVAGSWAQCSFIKTTTTKYIVSSESLRLSPAFSTDPDGRRFGTRPRYWRLVHVFPSPSPIILFYCDFE